MVIVLKCRNTKYLQADFIHVHILIFAVLTGKGDVRGRKLLSGLILL